MDFFLIFFFCHAVEFYELSTVVQGGPRDRFPTANCGLITKKILTVALRLSRDFLLFDQHLLFDV